MSQQLNHMLIKFELVKYNNNGWKEKQLQKFQQA